LFLIFFHRQQENEELSHQIVAIDKDIEQTTAIIQKIEELISQAKIEKGVNNIYKDAYKNKVEDEQNSKKNEDSSFINRNSENPTLLQPPPNTRNNTTIKPKNNQDGKITENPEVCKNCQIF